MKSQSQHIQPAMKYTEIAATPEGFMSRLNAATTTPRKPSDPRGVVAHITFNDVKAKS